MENPSPKQAPDWEAIRAQFNLSPEYAHLGASQYLVSHPEPVRRAIDFHRRRLDENPVMHIGEHEITAMQQAREAAASFLQLDDPDNIALTDSTTMGLGLVYGGLKLKPGDEILYTEHEYYSHTEAISLAVQRSGAHCRTIPMYREPCTVTQDEIVRSVLEAIRDETRVLALTWVHSNTGLKTPVSAIGRRIAQINAGRSEEAQILLIVDGVHGFGVERETFPELACSVFISGCHKWTYGPRGTGLIAATTQAWQRILPVIPSFTDAMWKIMKEEKKPSRMGGKQATPGGFHSLEYRWALSAAFEFMESIGKEHVWQRVHQLARQLKEGLASMEHVILHTPLADELSAGIIAFEIKGLEAEEAEKKLWEQKIIATASPYRKSNLRFTPGIINTPEEVERGLEAVRRLKQ